MDTLVAPEALQTNTAQIAQQFNNGELAFIVSTSEIIMQTRFHGNMGGLSNARIGSDSVMVVPIPRGKVGSVSFIGGSNLAIPASNKRKEALDLLLFLTDDENLDAYTKQIGLLPPSRKVLQTWAEDEEYRVLVRALETGRAYVAIPEWGELEQQLNTLFSAIWEQMEIPSLYSEDKLYEIFKDLTVEIDKKLNYPTTNIMTAAEFKAAWNKINEENKPKVEATKDSTNKAVDSNMQKAPFVFVVMLVLGFLFAFLRRRKR
jgi:multiple sugar transport system substrate-binding protein